MLSMISSCLWMTRASVRVTHGISEPRSGRPQQHNLHTLHTVTRLLSKYLRLPSADKPPTQEAHKAGHDDDDCDGDPRDGTSGEAALVRASAGTVTVHEVAENRALIIRWRSAARAVSDTLDATACLCTQLACFTGVQVTARWTGAALIGLISFGACGTSRMTFCTVATSCC